VTVSGLGAADTPVSIGVRVVQRGLLAAGVTPSPGTPDNDWGPLTERSLSAWLTTEAGRYRLSASSIRDSLRLHHLPGATAITLPNALASRLEQLSGQYSASSSRARPSSSTSSSVPTTAPAAASVAHTAPPSTPTWVWVGLGLTTVGLGWWIWRRFR